LIVLLIAHSVFFPACRKEADKPQVILLITIDTLRKDHLGCFGYERNTSPFIDQLAKNGILFKNAISPLPLTDPSHASIHTALHPLVHGVNQNSTKLPQKAETIAEVMKKNGFHTIAAVAVFHMSKVYQFNQGFDSYADKWEKTNHNDHWQRTAQSVNQDLFKQIADYKKKHKSKPLFIWTHYYDPHVPYINRKEIHLDKPDKNKPDKNPNIESYDKEIRYTDNAVSALLDFLKNENLLEKATICITSDHGEQLGEHNVFGDHKDIYSETVFVPVIFSGYGIPRNRTFAEYISTMDIAPTLLNLAGLKYTAPVHGRNLLDQNREPINEALAQRNFMVIGNPRLTRSLEWIEQPFGFIMNYENHYKQMYLSLNSSFPQTKLKAVPQTSLVPTYYKKSDKYSIAVQYPNTLRKELYIGILRLDVKKNSGLAVGYEIGTRVKALHMCKDGQTGTFTAFFPITPLDTLTGLVYFKKGTLLENFRFALIPANDCAPYLQPESLTKNSIFTTLDTPRKNKPGNQLYHLGTDFPMLKNLLEAASQRTPPQAVHAQKQLMLRLEAFRKESKRINGASRRQKPLTDKEKEMLKSLGYL